MAAQKYLLKDYLPSYWIFSKKVFLFLASPVIIPSTITKESFVIKLQTPRDEIRFCQVVLITLSTNGSLPKPSQYVDNYNSYHDAQASAQPSSYIAAEFDIVDFEKFREFTVGDGSVSLGVVGMSKYGAAVREYFNGPLSSDTLYTVYQRFYNEKDLVYISDFLHPTKTKQKDNFDEFRGSQAMNRPFCASNKQLERKWQDMAYQRHREKLKAIKPRIRQELNKNKQEETYRVQRRLMRVLGEERRQEIIAKENNALLVRILNIMASPSRIDTWNVSYINNANARREREMKESGQQIAKDEKPEKEEKDKAEEKTTQLPPIQ
ncbi:Hypothetical predicted protein [Paramuricea clavata]|uniref:Uncharacterized protein n=1 Tax=Paramuricea clavata TaxID=317549 RepID=A0A7D9EFA4_PARCT|nr:Hypothetical predicted protein [Paramuricea clavata]